MLYILLAGPIIFIIATILLGIITPEHRSKENYISELSLGKYGWIQKINFIICGLSIFGLSYLIFNISQTSVERVGWTLGFVIGSGMIILGIFDTSYGLRKKTVGGSIHEFVYMNVLSPSIGIAYFILGWAYRNDLIITLLSWTIGIISLLFFKFTDKLKLGIGTSQRIIVFMTVVWIELLSITILFNLYRG